MLTASAYYLLAIAQKVEIAMSLANEFLGTLVENAVERELIVAYGSVRIGSSHDIVEVIECRLAQFATCLQSCLGSNEVDFLQTYYGIVVVERRRVVTVLARILQQ